MAKVFKRAYIDRKTGQRRKTKNYYAKIPNGLGGFHRVPLCSDKVASEAMLRELLLKSNREKAGLADPFEEHRRKPLAVHLEEFSKMLADKGNTTAHCELVSKRAADVVTGCGFKFIKDISASRVQSFLADLKRGGKSQQTANHYLRAVKQLTRWLVRDHRTDDDRLAHLEGGNVKTDRRLERRELTEAEIAGLLKAAKAGPVRGKLTGWQRFTLYSTALGTGLRAKELGSLTPADFDLASSPPTVRIEAENEKARRGDVLPLPPDLVELLKPWLATLPKREAIWGGKWSVNKGAGKFMKLDLKVAGVAYTNEDGQADFHALRHTFLSRLGRSGCPAKVMQRLARHSTVELTIGRYTHASLYDLGAAVAKLPMLPTGTEPSSSEVSCETLKATGTDGVARRLIEPSKPIVESVEPVFRGQAEPSLLAPNLAQLAPNLVQQPDGDCESLRVIRLEDARIDSEAENKKALQMQGFESDCKPLSVAANTERGGFEPPNAARRLRFSRPVQSAALPSLRGGS